MIDYRFVNNHYDRCWFVTGDNLKKEFDLGGGDSLWEVYQDNKVIASISAKDWSLLGDRHSAGRLQPDNS